MSSSGGALHRQRLAECDSSKFMKGNSFDLDACLTKARQCQTLEESEVRDLCFLVKLQLYYGS